jgi:2-dehydro-3-deoxyglucarate aldolase/4-hydroxy-2-oxoheptanedioate aldolase
MPTRFRDLLAGNELIRTFALSRVVHPVLVEMFGLAGGYHGFWLDNEHVALTSEQIVVAALAARANNFDCFVRIPPVGYWLVTQCLETGVGGVMAAQIHSADQAEQFAQWARFAPHGGRGLNTGGRDANYTHMTPAEFVVEANRNTFVAIQIETLGAVDDVDRIAATPGVDLLFVGPADLSLALGVVGQFHHETLWEAIDRVAAACRRHGKAWGAVTPDARFAERAIDGGCRMPTFCNDVLVLRRGIAATQTTYESHF